MPSWLTSIRKCVILVVRDLIVASKQKAPKCECVNQRYLNGVAYLILKGVFRMGQAVLDKIAEVRADFESQLAAAQARIDEDFTEVKRKLDEALASGNDGAAVAALDEFKASVDASLGTVNPDPNFPAPVEPPA